MCWKTMAVVAVILIASFFMTPSASMDKEGFITYVVYGPEGLFGGWPGYGRGWGGPGGWGSPWWGWRRRHWWRGPCPGPWCPYY